MKGGINFEEWKEIVKKNRRSLRSKSNSFKFEPESLTYGAEKAVKSPEYGQVHTITYNVTGVDVPSSWPTEIKSGKTLTIPIIIPEGYELQDMTVSAQYTYENGDLVVQNVQSDLSIEFAIVSSGPAYVEIAGIKWATMNIGANSVTDTGLYFQWGDTQGYTASQVGSGEGQKAFKWANYKYGNGSSSPGDAGMTKYNSSDGKTVLDASDDAVQAAWGGNWRMPTTAEFQALDTATTSAWTSSYEGSGVAGLVLTSNADSSKKLFFPACGSCSGGGVNYAGSDGSYWSSSLYSSSVQSAYALGFYSDYVFWQGSGTRGEGCTVRGVLDDSTDLQNVMS